MPCAPSNSTRVSQSSYVCNSQEAFSGNQNAYLLALNRLSYDDRSNKNTQGRKEEKAERETVKPNVEARL